MKTLEILKLEKTISKNNKTLYNLDQEIRRFEENILPIVDKIKKLKAYLNKISSSLQENEFEVNKKKDWDSKSKDLIKRIEEIIKLINPIIKDFSEKELTTIVDLYNKISKDFSEKELEYLDYFEIKGNFINYKNSVKKLINSLECKNQSRKNRYNQTKTDTMSVCTKLEDFFNKEITQKILSYGNIVHENNNRLAILKKEKEEYSNNLDFSLKNKNKTNYEEFQNITKLNNKVKSLTKEIASIEEKQEKLDIKIKNLNNELNVLHSQVSNLKEEPFSEIVLDCNNNTLPQKAQDNSLEMRALLKI